MGALILLMRGSHVDLWVTNQGHVLYPTSKCLATFLADNAKEYIEGKRVLELGAGGGLPSLISALEGSKKVRLAVCVHIASIDNTLHTDYSHRLSGSRPNTEYQAQH